MDQAIQVREGQYYAKFFDSLGSGHRLIEIGRNPAAVILGEE